MSNLIFSYSHLRSIKTCPHGYKLQYIDKKYIPHDNRRFIKPDAIDQGVTQWIKMGTPAGKLEEVCLAKFDLFASKWKMQWRNPTDRDVCRVEVKDGASKIEQAFQDADIMHGEIDAQTSFELVFPQHMLTCRGKLDIWDKKNHRIYDLKFTESSKWLDSTQLVWYDMCMSAITEKKVSEVGFIVPLMNPKVQREKITREHWQHVLNQLTESVRIINAKEFAPNTDSCGNCLLKSICGIYNNPGGHKLVVSGRKQKMSL